MKIERKKRLLVASKIYAGVLYNFVHWRPESHREFDAEYQSYLRSIIDDPDRLRFDISTLKFVAGLGNGHTTFSDDWLWREHGAPIGLYADRVGSHWIVTRSIYKKIPLGSELAALDGVAIDAFFATKRPFIAASNERGQATALFGLPFLFPRHFVLTTADGKSHDIERSGANYRNRDLSPRFEINDVGILIVTIPSFGDPDYEKTVCSRISEALDAPAIVIDIRGNGGGSTPEQLIELLMDRPYRYWQETALLGLPPDRALYQRSSEMLDSGGIHQPTITWPSQTKRPIESPYMGKLALVVDQGTQSAAEDFAVGFKDNGRAMLIGSPTGGSSGQPYILPLGQEMHIRIGAKVERFPDGSTFEGVGIQPDVCAVINSDALLRGQDNVMALALDRVLANNIT